MKKISMAIIFAALLLLQIFSVCALTGSEARQEWLDAKQLSKEKQEVHLNAKLDFAANKSEEKRQRIVDTGKDVLNAALDEAEAWLVWKRIEAEENSEVPEDIKQTINSDVEANLAKISALRTDVTGVDNQLELGIVFLKMVGKYFELLSDVARNSGAMWVHIGNTQADKIENYEAKLREAAENIDNNDNILKLLDNAHAELEIARRNIDNAKLTYEQVRLPGTPLIKFAEGNNYLRAARSNLLAASLYLNQAFTAISAGGA